MSIPISFTAAVDLADGRHISVSIDIPEDHLSLLHDGDFLEHTEIAQMGAAHVLRTLRRCDQSRNRRMAEDEVAF